MNDASRARRRVWVAGIVIGLLLCIAVAAARVDGAAVPGQDVGRDLDGGSAELRFPAPTPHAIVLLQPGPARALYGGGDVIVHPQEPGGALTVVRVEASHLVVREGAVGRPQVLRAGDSLPGFPGRTFAGTVLLDAVQYRYRSVERIVHGEPVLLALEGARALLEVEVPHPAGVAPAGTAAAPGRPTLDAAVLGQVQVRALAPDRYEVPAPEVQAVLEEAGRVLAELAPGVLPRVSTTGGVEYHITSAASDGVLGRQGFTVWAPKLAARAGIEVGDTILSVNGIPVDGWASLSRIYGQIRRTPALATVQVELERGGSRVTKTYRLR
jgi:PDZ domain